MRRAIVLLVVVALAGCGSDDDEAPATTTTSTTTTSTTTAPIEGEGAADVGDPYFPGLGNGGYDVTSYDLALQVDPEAESLGGVATIEATATQDLAAFNLDLVGLTASAVTVDGEAAATTHVDRELRIEPVTAIGAGTSFTVEVTYSGEPRPLDSGVALLPDVGWFPLGAEGSYVLSEPSGAATWFPANDHPSDKATYTFHISVPEGMEAAANGQLESSVTRAGRTTWTWASDDPMASYLAIVVVGELTLDEPTTVGTVVVRNIYADSVVDRVGSTFDRQPEMLAFYGEQFGAYPFDAYGVVVIDHELFVALETQTLSLFGNDTLGGGEILVAHELAHQWFGDAVTPATWRDVWLNEGFATWAEWLWAEHRGPQSIDESARDAHDFLVEEELGGLPPGDPGAELIFAPSVYQRGALALYALRSQVGGEVMATILRTWVERFSGQAATTADFIAVAEDVSGVQLDELFDLWLYAAELPPLPSP